MRADENRLESGNRLTDPTSVAEFHYTFDWFSHNIAVWEKHLRPFAGQPDLRFLEIGSFEGRSAVWLITNILTHETSRIECIECFEGIWQWESKTVDMVEVERRFDHNMCVAQATGKVTKIKAASREALRRLPFEAYDLVYVDGSHIAADVLEDAVLSFPLLKPGGILIFDDYQLVRDHELTVPKSAIDAFLNVYRGRYETLHREFQVIIRKTIEKCVVGEEISVAMEILDVRLHELDHQQLWGCNLEAPRPGGQSAGHTLDVIGWVLGRQIPVTAVEIVAAGQVVQAAPLNVRRPDVAACYPEVADGERSGFQVVVNVDRSPEQDLLVQAVLQNQSRVLIGIIRVQSKLVMLP